MGAHRVCSRLCSHAWQLTPKRDQVVQIFIKCIIPKYTYHPIIFKSFKAAPHCKSLVLFFFRGSLIAPFISPFHKYTLLIPSCFKSFIAKNLIATPPSPLSPFRIPPPHPHHTTILFHTRTISSTQKKNRSIRLSTPRRMDSCTLFTVPANQFALGAGPGSISRPC